MIVAEKMKTKESINWAEVIKDNNFFNRATHIELEKHNIDERSWNLIREITFHWQVFVFLFCQEWAFDHRNGRLISLVVIKTCPSLFALLSAIIRFFDLAFLVWNSLAEERGNKRTVVSVRNDFTSGDFRTEWLCKWIFFWKEFQIDRRTSSRIAVWEDLYTRWFKEAPLSLRLECNAW